MQHFIFYITVQNVYHVGNQCILKAACHVTVIKFYRYYVSTIYLDKVKIYCNLCFLAKNATVKFVENQCSSSSWKNVVQEMAEFADNN